MNYGILFRLLLTMELLLGMTPVVPSAADDAALTFNIKTDMPVGNSNNGPASVAGSDDSLYRSDRARGDDSMEVSVRIVFPQAYNAGAAKKTGDVCFTPEDTPGVCRPFDECDFFKDYSTQHSYASRIRFCKTTSRTARLICCPELKSRQGELDVNEKTGGPMGPYQSSYGIMMPVTTAKIQEDTTTAAPSMYQYGVMMPVTTTANTKEDTMLAKITASPFTSPAPAALTTASGKAADVTHEGLVTTTTVAMKQGDSSSTVVTEAPPTIPAEPNLPSSIDLNKFDFGSDEAQNVCGAFDGKQQENWPWIVSIGRKYGDNGTIEWLCLGSLITTEYILTTAHCLQRSPNVAAVGIPMMGTMTVSEVEENVVVRSIAESSQFRKYTFPNLYKNIGLAKLSEPIGITSQESPVCFPFLAGILDIIDFNGWEAFSLGSVPEGQQVSNRTSDNFKIGAHRIAKNSLCSPVFSKRPSNSGKRLPHGLKTDVMCALSNRNYTLCPVEGSPLVVFDPASASYVVIGIGSGDETCTDFKTKITLFTRINAFSSWVRDSVTDLPTPPQCYA